MINGLRWRPRAHAYRVYGHPCTGPTRCVHPIPLAQSGRRKGRLRFRLFRRPRWCRPAKSPSTTSRTAVHLYEIKSKSMSLIARFLTRFPPYKFVTIMKFATSLKTLVFKYRVLVETGNAMSADRYFTILHFLSRLRCEAGIWYGL